MSDEAASTGESGVSADVESILASNEERFEGIISSEGRSASPLDVGRFVDVVVEGSGKDFVPESWLNDVISNSENLDASSKMIMQLISVLSYEYQENQGFISVMTDELFSSVRDSAKEIIEVEEDSKNLNNHLNGIASQISAMDQSSLEAIRQLKRIDKIKQRMDDCSKKLLEIDNWHKKINHFEKVFDTKNIFRICEEIQSMETSLVILCKLPLHEKREIELEKCKDQLLNLSKAPLVQALEDNNFNEFSSIYRSLRNIHRADSVIETYLTFVSDKVQLISSQVLKLNSSSDLNIDSWLPSLYESIVDFLREQSSWIHGLSKSSLQLLNTQDLFERVTIVSTKVSIGCLGPWIVERVSFDDTQRHYKMMSSFFDHTKKFIKEIILLWMSHFALEVFTPSTSNSFIKLIQILIEPIQNLINSHSKFEMSILSPSIESVILKMQTPSANFIVEDSLARNHIVSFIKNFDDSIPETFSILESSVERFVKMSGGVTISSFIQSISYLYEKYIHNILNQWKILNKISGFDSFDDLSIEKFSIEWADVPLAFQLYRSIVKFKISLEKKMQFLWSSNISPRIRKILKAKENLSNTCLPADFLSSLDEIIYSTITINFSKEDLISLQEIGSDDSFLGLVNVPIIERMMVDLFNSSEAYIFDCLMFKFRLQLRNLHQWPRWKDSSSSLLSLASFTAQPTDTITNVGDELFAAVQVLEINASDDGEHAKSSSQISHEQNGSTSLMFHWIEKLIEGICNLLVTKISLIPILSPKGSVQVRTDLEYFINIVDVLGVTIPNSVISLKEMVSLSADELNPSNFQDPVLQHVAKKILIAMKRASESKNKQ